MFGALLWAAIGVLITLIPVIVANVLVSQRRLDLFRQARLHGELIVRAARARACA